MARFLRLIRFMTFRITKQDHKGGTLLRIDGDLHHAGLTVLERSYEDAKMPLTIDVEGLKSVDGPVLEVLRRLARNGANLTGASPYLALQLSARKKRN